MPVDTRLALSAAELTATLERLAEEIHQAYPQPAALVVVGIRTGGAFWLSAWRTCSAAAPGAPEGGGPGYHPLSG